MEDLSRFYGVKPFRDGKICTEIVLHGPLFQFFSPAALLKPLRYSILVRSPLQAENFVVSGFSFELYPPLVFPQSETRGVIIQNIGRRPEIWKI